MSSTKLNLRKVALSLRKRASYQWTPQGDEVINRLQEALQDEKRLRKANLDPAKVQRRIDVLQAAKNAVQSGADEAQLLASLGDFSAKTRAPGEVETGNELRSIVMGLTHRKYITPITSADPGQGTGSGEIAEERDINSGLAQLMKQHAPQATPQRTPEEIAEIKANQEYWDQLNTGGNEPYDTQRWKF